jgi:hypothetical protein
MENKELELRKKERENLEFKEENLKRKQDLLEKEKYEIHKKEINFFPKQVGKYFKTKSGERFFKILDYDGKIFEVKYYNLGDNVEKTFNISVYNIFEIEEISEEEYFKNLK